MKLRLIAIAFIFSALFVQNLDAKKPVNKNEGSPVTIRIASYSIYAPKHRAQNVSSKPDVPLSRLWSNSGPALAAQIKDLDCDVLGLQAVDDTVVGLTSSETLEMFLKKAGVSYYKLEAYSNAEPNNPYQGKIQWTTNGLLYRTDRLKLMDSGVFWLAGNENAPERGEKCTFPQIALDRTCIWGKFKEKSSGKEFYVFSTELNGTSFKNKGRPYHDIGPNMLNAKEINKIAAKIVPAGTPAFLAADILNSDTFSKNSTFQKFCEMWKDSRFAATDDGKISDYEKSLLSTMNEQNNSEPRARLHRDNVFFMNAKLLWYKVDRRRFQATTGAMVYPSNHFPVVVDFELQ